MDHRAELYEDMRHKKTQEDNTYKLYALLWEQYANSMPNKIASRSDYNSSVYNNSIALLRAIEEHLLNYQKVRYEMVILLYALQ